jgi:hypothetical protein
MKQSATQVPDEHTSPVAHAVPSGLFTTVQVAFPLHVDDAWHGVGVHAHAELGNPSWKVATTFDSSSTSFAMKAPVPVAFGSKRIVPFGARMSPTIVESAPISKAYGVDVAEVLALEDWT